MTSDESGSHLSDSAFMRLQDAANHGEDSLAAMQCQIEAQHRKEMEQDANYDEAAMSSFLEEMYSVSTTPRPTKK